MAHCEQIVSVSMKDILDMRDSLAGFDFRLRQPEPPWLVEVKGLRGASGSLRFTDLEWRVASRARQHYALVVIHSLDKDASWKVICDPVATLKAVQRIERRVVVAWASQFNSTL
jgi:hypothetical protein